SEGGDPLWARKWALENLRKGGALDPIEQVLELPFQTADPAGSARLIHEAGLLVHFIKNGGDKKVGRAWEAFRSDLVDGKPTEKSVEALESAILKSVKKIEALYRG
ncbi:MAG: hypothetical protein AAGG01_15970, partial [Planctomycetota bacterium]